MPSPYLSCDEINGLIRTLPMYCYFPKSEWPQIERAEKNDQLGNTILKKYSDIYKNEFLGETQGNQSPYLVDGPGGCRSNPKDSYPLQQTQFTTEEIEKLTV